MPVREHHLPVIRTARYVTLGEPGNRTQQVWLVLHGFGQLARIFVREFEPLDDGRRLIVAPEALSRFYLDPAGGRSPDARVGATWMTREDRLVEISDYIGYLDALYDTVFASVDRSRVSVVVLGFSQGVATAVRWLCRGRAQADHLVLWAGPFPPEIGAEDAAPLRATRVTRVLGSRDELATAEALAAEEERIETAGLRPELRRFEGGHRLDASLLLELAG